MEGHTMSTATDNAWTLLQRATLADDDLGYPNGVEFLALDLDDWHEILWESLQEGRPTVLVDENAHEVLLEPARRPLILHWLDRLQGKRWVRIAWRSNNHHYDVPARLDRESVYKLDADNLAAPA